jgi:hypothetical protein
MNPFLRLSGKFKGWRAVMERQRLRERCPGPVADITRAEWEKSRTDPSLFYLQCCRYFDQNLPEELRAHRRYFTENQRGFFGEDAFHTMWFLLFREFRPASFLEIGVYRGQSLSLAALLACRFKLPCFVQGVSPFSSAGDAYSSYRPGLDYLADTLQNFAHFSLPSPSLLKAYSTDEEAQRLIASRAWDIIYIDGNHDYEIVRRDWNLCSGCLSPGGLMVLDDAGLTSKFRPPAFATAGHPGPSRLAREINHPPFVQILQVGHNRVFQKLPS